MRQVTELIDVRDLGSDEPAPKCPVCDSGMKLRVARLGPRKGLSFWGCELFPACRGTRTTIGVRADEESSVAHRSLDAVDPGFRIDSFVYTPRKGFGKIRLVEERTVDVEFFRSTRRDDSFVETIAKRLVTAKRPPNGQSCRFRQGNRWHAGRIWAVVDDQVWISQELRAGTVEVPISDVFIRCTGELPDPIDVIAAGVLDDPGQAASRSGWTEILYSLRGACRGMAGLASSHVELHRHQVEIISRVLRDPVQRYILADEVGLGKTVEAGIILRQFLLDHPDSTAVVIVPKLLAGQWARELREKFGIDEFESERVKLLPHDPATWQNEDCGLLIVDEVHHLASGARSDNAGAAVRYEALAELSRRAERVLLLSATPLLHNESTFLGMLHLIDPMLYRLEDLEGFKRRVDQKREFAYRFQAFESSAASYVLEEHAEAFCELLPADTLLTGLLKQVLQCIESDETHDETFTQLVGRARVHLGETYRLHRRVLRTRRDSPLAAAFPVRGRQSPTLSTNVAPNQHEIDDWVEGWFDLVSIRLVNGAFESSAIPVFVGLLDRLPIDPAVTIAFVQSWLELTEEIEAALTVSEFESIKACRPTDAERSQLDKLLSILEAGELQQRWATRTAAAVLLMPVGTVVFSGYPHAAQTLYDALVGELGAADVAIYLGDDDTAVEESFKRFAGGQARYLVCGPNAEEGRNIQFARSIFHAHVPWDPSRLEQRIGRVDRFGIGTKVAGCVAVAPGSLTDHWFALLRDGFGVFDESIATLQHVLAGTVAEAFQQLVAFGPSAWIDYAGDLKKRLAVERLEISRLENLESIEAESSFARALFEELNAVEVDEASIELKVEGWLCGAQKSHGLGLGVTPAKDRSGIRTYGLPKTTNPPLPRELVDSYLARFLGKPTTAFRSVAKSETNRTQFLRPGDAFFEGIRSLTDAEDLGQTFGFWRRGPFDEPEVVVLLMYRLEAPVEHALDSLRATGHRIDEATVQRVLDGFFPPVSLRMRFDRWGKQPSETLLRRIEAPYSVRSDVPISSRYIPDIERTLDLDWAEWWQVIGIQAFESATEEADLARRKGEATVQAVRSFEDACYKLRLRIQSDNDDRQIQILQSELRLIQLLDAGIRVAIDAARPVPESVGLILVCRDRPDELWDGHD